MGLINLRNKFFSFLLVFCLFLIPADPLNSEFSPNKTEQEKIQHEVTVALKLVQIYVTDKNDNPITDLGKSDFDLYDNGKLKKITDFERHVLSLPSIQAKSPKVKRESPPTESLNRKFFLLFDFAFNSISGINMAKKAALHFIDTQVNPTDEIGTLSYSTLNGLILHEYLTTDHEKIHQIINRIGSKTALGRAGRLLQDIESEVWRGGEWVGTGMGPEAGGDRQQIQDRFKRIAGETQLMYQVQNFTSAIRDWAKALQHIPGNKNILLFSVGVPNYLIYPHAASIAKPGLNANLRSMGSADLRNRYEKMSKDLAASNSTVYAINVEGLDAELKDSAGRSAYSRSVDDWKNRRGESLYSIEDRDRRGVASLLNISKISGGKYFSNINDYEKIVEEIQNLTGSYYVLGYYIDDKWDGKYHKIKVNIKRKGCKVYGQRGYFNPKPFKEYSELERKIHLIDLALSENPHFGIPINFSMTALPYSVENEPKIVMISEIPAEKIEEILGEKTEIIFLVFDDKKNIVTYQRMEAKNSSYSLGNIFCYAISSLPPGKYNCREVIRNLETGRTAVASSSVIVPKTPDSGIKQYSPLLLVPKSDGHYSFSTTERRTEEEKQYSTLVKIYPFDSTQYVPLLGGIKRGTPNILMITRCSVFNIPNPEVFLRPRLINQDTNETITADTSFDYNYYDDVFISSLELKTNELQPGSYILFLLAGERTTGSKSNVYTIFTIE